jgi:hypothetical protein
MIFELFEVTPSYAQMGLGTFTHLKLPQRLQQIYQNIKIVGKFNPKKTIQILVTHDGLLSLIKPIN